MVRRPSKVERRRSILGAARKVFVRKGYAATRMSDIAAEASVGKGTLYAHFSSKEDLFSTLVLVIMRDSLETLGRKTPSPDPVETLRTTIAFMVKVALEESLDLYHLFFDFWGVSPSTRRPAQKQLKEVVSSFRGFIADTVRRGQDIGAFRAEVDPEQHARALCAAVDGLSLQLVILGDDVDLDHYASHLQQLFLGGLMTEGALGGASILREET
jgi:TetR/AcrR family fatty acid metabolism transcriptional regulator